MRRRILDKGFSLIELIVAFAIFAIAGLAITGFVSFGSRSYGQANKNVKLQYEQQVVVNRVRDVILETSRAISYDSSTSSLYVLGDSDDTDNPYKAIKIRFDEDENKLYISDSQNFPKGTTMASIISGFSATEYVLSDSISEFNADLDELADNKVILTFTFKVGDKELTVNPEVLLRNVITVADDSTDIDALYKKTVVEVESKVKDVVISRDGYVFTQARTDTIAMAGNSTTVDYDAVVNKKKYYTGDIKTTVTWSIDISSVKEGYESYISIDADGKVTVRRDSTGTLGPEDFMASGGYFVIKAASDEDPTKYAKLRIKVTGDGVYPVSIAFNAPTVTADTTNGLLVYIFSNSITYTGQVADPVTGKLMNPLTGDGVYTKITYSVKEADDGTLSIPKGAGFSETTVDGRFIAVKSMEGNTYTIVATVIQRDKEGNAVKAEYPLTITVGSVPDVDDESTEPVLNLGDEGVILRNADNPVSASWSNGVPTYTENGTTKQYYYWYEWEIEKGDDNNWGNKDINDFDKNVFFKSNSGQSLTTGLNESVVLLRVRPELDWSKIFTVKATVRMKISKQNNKDSAVYYMKPGTDTEHPGLVETDDRSLAAKDSKTVTIPKVELSMTPADIVFTQNDKPYENAIFNTSENITLKYNTSAWKDYYMVFTPIFKGIYVTPYTVSTNKYYIPDGTFYMSIRSKYTIGGNESSSVWLKAGGYFYSISEYAYENAFKVHDDANLYGYFKINLWNWKNGVYGASPSNMRWYCIVDGPSGNNVQATFPSGSDYMEYTLTYK